MDRLESVTLGDEDAGGPAFSMKFSGSNFQAWPAFDLEISGLTVVTGVSNRGKSAIFRALQGLLRNELSAAFVRNGQKRPLYLTLDYNGHTVIAERARDGSSAYRIDGKAFAKLAGQIPDDLKTLGFGEIKIGEFAIDPIFAIQNEPQFLLDKKTYSPGMLNAILGAFGGTEKLEAGKKEANLRITHKNGEAKTLSFEIAEAEQRKATLETLSAEGSQIANEIHRLESSARILEHRAGWTRLAHQRRLRLAPLLQILSALEVPDITEVSNLQIKAANLQNINRYRANLKQLGGLETSLEQVTAGWSEIVSLYKKIRALQDIAPLVEQKQKSTALVDAKEINNIIGQIETLASEAIRRERSIRLFGQVAQMRARVAELEHERLHIEAQQDAASKVKCPECGTEF